MKNPVLIHAIWLLVAAGAFAAGKYGLPLVGLEGKHGTSAGVAVDPAAAKRSKNASKGALGGKNARERSEFVRNFVGPTGPMTSASMVLALRAALSDGDKVNASLKLAELLKELTPENALEAKAVIEELSPGRSGFANLMLFNYAWGKIDGESALASAMAEKDERRRGFYASNALSGWASANPRAAIAWFESDATGESADWIARGLISGLAENDPGIAADYVMTMPRENRGRHLGTLIDAQLKNGGVEAATSWASSLGESDLRASAFDNLSRYYAGSNLEAGMKWAEIHASQDHGPAAVGEIAERLAERDSREALHWATSLPEGPSRNRALRETFNEWARENSNDAIDYAEKMLEGAERDAAISGLAARVSEQDPAAAVAWAETISDSGQRAESIVDLGSRWLRRDQAGAGEWLQNSGLPAAMVARIEEASKTSDWQYYRR